MTDREELLGLKPHQALAVVAGAMALAILAIGYSGGVAPQAVRAAPVIAAAILAWRSPAFGRWALAPILLIWLFACLAVWFYILGGPTPIRAQPVSTESLLEGVLGVFAVMGFSLFFWIRAETRAWLGLGVAALFGGAQIWALLLTSPI